MRRPRPRFCTRPMQCTAIFLLFVLFFVAVCATEDVAPLTSESTRKSMCPKYLDNLGGACQCHLIRIRAIWVFKRITFEGMIQSCRNRFGPFCGWKLACNTLTESPHFQKKEAIAAVREIIDECPGTLCNFFVY